MNMAYKNNATPEVRRIGKMSKATLFVTFPAKLADELGFQVGDYVKVLTDGHKTIAFEKIKID